MTPKDLDTIAAAMAQSLKSTITPVTARLDGLEQRLAALEAKPHVKFCGTWAAGRAYVPGDAATRQGGLWVCREATSGEWNFAHWQLAVKSKGAA